MVCVSSPHERFQELSVLECSVESHWSGADLIPLTTISCAFSDEEKIQFEWNTGSNVDTKKMASNFPVDLSGYPKSLHKYANSLLDYRVPQTDKTFRHMGSKLIVVSTNQSINKYMVTSANYICNPELGERGDPKMDKACSLPPRNSWGKKKRSCIVAQLYRLYVITTK